jgi:hypothetical protein
VIRWLTANADAFRLISFQPLAHVGRTEPGLGGVDVEELWRQIAIGFEGDGASPDRLAQGQMWVGHPDCSRCLAGVLLSEPGVLPRFHPVRAEGDAPDRQVVDRFLSRFGGISFRLDSPLERLARCAGVLCQDPAFILGSLPGFLAAWLRRLSPDHPWRQAVRLALGRAKLRGLVVITHHFMNQEQVRTARGRERLDLCVFHVPLEGRLVPMCEANSTGLREQFYGELLRRHGPRVASVAPPGPGVSAHPLEPTATPAAAPLRRSR